MTRRSRMALLAALWLAAACSSSDGAAGPDAGGTAGDTVIDAAPAPDTAGPVPDAAPGSDAAPDAPAPGPDAPSADTGDTAGGALAPADWCSRWPAAYCALLARCPLPGLETRTEADCRAAVGAGCDGAAVAAAVAEERLAWAPGAAAACLAALGSLPCAALYEELRTARTAPDAACAAVLTGLVPAGGACFLGTECAAGSLCTFGPLCPGTCTAVAAPGAECGGDAWCDFAAAACVGGTCQALPETEDAPCLAGQCHAPLLCDPATDTCRTPGLAGAECSGGAGVCLPGLLCFGAEGGGGTCQPLRADGETCFANGDCRAPLVCVGGTCGAAPGPAEPCFDFLCAAAWCDTAAIPPTCVAWPAEDAACAPGSRCAPEHVCDAGICRARRPAGADCTAHQQCAAGRCYGGACRARAEAACAP